MLRFTGFQHDAVIVTRGTAHRTERERSRGARRG